MRLPSGTFSVNYAQDTAIVRTRLQWLLLLSSLAILFFLLPQFLNREWFSIIIFLGIYIISILGLNILLGLTGQISLGHAAFMGIGGYTSAILTANYGLSFWLALPAAGISAALVGALFGLTSLRLKHIYLALVTIAIQFIFYYTIVTFNGVTGGPYGMSVDRPSIFGYTLASHRSYYYLVMAMVVVMTFFAKNLARTRVGRTFVAIRDNEVAARAMGVNLFHYKLLAFAIGSGYAGISGSLLVHYARWATPEYFNMLESVWLIAMLIIGGLGSTVGVFLGVAFVRLLNDKVVPVLADKIGDAFPSMSTQVGAAMAPVVFGLIIILFLLYEQRGLAHRWEKIKASYRLWPFAY